MRSTRSARSSPVSSFKTRSSPVSSFKTRSVIQPSDHVRPIATIPSHDRHAKIISMLRTPSSPSLVRSDDVAYNRSIDLLSLEEPSEMLPPNSSSPSGITSDTYRSLFGFSPFNVDADDESDASGHDLYCASSFDQSLDKVQKHSGASSKESDFMRSLTPDQYNELYTNIVNRAIFETWNDKNQNLAMSQFLLKEYYRLIDEMVTVTKSSPDKDFRENIHYVYKKLISKVYNTIDFYASKI